MTVSTSGNSIQYTGNGVTTTFSFPYPFYENTDLIVTYTVIATGVDTVKTITTDYTVAGGGGASGSVTVTGTAPASTIRITITRSVPLTQETDLIEGSAVLADTIEKSLDKATILIQQVSESVVRSLKFPNTISGSLTGILPAPEDGKFLVWSGTDGEMENAEIASLGTFDTLFTSLSSGDILTYNGTNWVNTAQIAGSQIEDDAITTQKVLDDSITLDKIEGNASYADKFIAYDASGDPINGSVGDGLDMAAGVISVVAGAIVQVVSAEMTGTFTSSGNSYQDITGLTASITPKSTSNKILVLVQVQGDTNTNMCFLKLVRESTDIGVGAAASSRTRASSAINLLGSSGAFLTSANIMHIDSPATTSSTTYKVQGIVPSSGTFYINQSQTDTDAATFGRTSSKIILMEVKG